MTSRRTRSSTKLDKELMSAKDEISISTDVSSPKPSINNLIFCRRFINELINQSEDWLVKFSPTEESCTLSMLNKQKIELLANRRHDYFYLEIKVNGQAILPDNPFWLSQSTCVNEKGIFQLLKNIEKWKPCAKTMGKRSQRKCLLICEQQAVMCAVCAMKK
uniref:Uncharacterized protein n=1 Tax=Strigamia maritima TaxID=126957 RepID=T1JGD3_STRMM